MRCDLTFLGACFARASLDQGYAIFGFAEFLAALALLVLVFNTGDFLYKFRISVAALPMPTLTFGAALIIGTGTLLTDLWFSERWYALTWGVSRAEIQGVFGLFFLLTVLLWMWVAFVRPPRFSRWNYRHFHRALFHAIVRGSNAQLPVVANEILYSAPSLVRLASERRRRDARDDNQNGHRKPRVSEYATETLFMLGNRKLCRHIVESSPVTAIVFMEEAAKQEKWSLPLGEFAHNITTEAILNKDSILYYEDEVYNWDVIGRTRPFSTAMYGNYRLVEGLATGLNSPLDLPWRVAWEMDGDRFEAYCRIVLITFKDYINGNYYDEHSYALFRAFEDIQNAGHDLYKLNGAPPEADAEDASARLRAAVGFVDDILKFLAEKKELRLPSHKSARAPLQETFCDHVAQLIFELIFSAASVRRPAERAWTIHYNLLWGRLFGLRRDSPAWKVIRAKLFRLIYDEIREMEKWPNYKGARILGLILNVQGLSIKRSTHHAQEYPLRKAVIEWTKRNYLRLVEANPDIAENVLSGGISFDAKKRRLVKTYAKGTQIEPDREYLDLEKPRSPLAAGDRANQRRPAANQSPIQKLKRGILKATGNTP
jgi:hypothetical protein